MEAPPHRHDQETAIPILAQDLERQLDEAFSAFEAEHATSWDGAAAEGSLERTLWRWGTDLDPRLGLALRRRRDTETAPWGPIEHHLVDGSGDRPYRSPYFPR